jgi:hypothetical protein
MDAALDDDLGVDLGRLLGELQRVADDVGDAVIDFRRLVVVRQDDGVALLFQPVDGGDIGCVDRPLDARDMVLDLLVEMLGLLGDLRRPFQDGRSMTPKRSAAVGPGFTALAAEV